MLTKMIEFLGLKFKFLNRCLLMYNISNTNSRRFNLDMETNGKSLIKRIGTYHYKLYYTNVYLDYSETSCTGTGPRMTAVLWVSAPTRPPVCVQCPATSAWSPTTSPTRWVQWREHPSHQPHGEYNDVNILVWSPITSPTRWVQWR